MLSAVSQALLRSEELLLQGKWLLVNPTDGQIFTQIENPNIFGFHQYFDIYKQSVAAAKSKGTQEQHTFAAAYHGAADFDGAVLFMPKSKAQAQMLLANIASCLKPGATILMVGENKSGIKSAPKLLDPYSTQINKIDSARHCAVYGGRIDKPLEKFELQKWQKIFTLNVAGLSYQICSLPGVFSHGELDAGTRLLLESIDKVGSGNLLDFACGTGIIGCFLGLKNPQSTVVMTDVSALAIYCATKSTELNGLDAKIIPSNGLAEITGRFDDIYTNPPFHTGIQTDYSVTETFISQLKPRLKPSGSLTLVANKFLRYSQLLEQKFASVYALAQTTKFSVYYCQRCK
jgi:16S rRNA (guanine1207-N2)-methyltransferase